MDHHFLVPIYLLESFVYAGTYASSLLIGVNGASHALTPLIPKHLNKISCLRLEIMLLQAILIDQEPLAGLRGFGGDGKDLGENL